MIERSGNHEIGASETIETQMAEIEKRIPTFIRETSQANRKRIFQDFIVPRLKAIKQSVTSRNDLFHIARQMDEAIKNAPVARSLFRSYLRQIPEISVFAVTGPNALREKEWTRFAEDFLSEVSTENRIDEDLEIDQTNIEFREAPPEKKSLDGEARQPHDKGMSRRRARYIRREQKQSREQERWGGLIVPSDEGVRERKDGLKPFHDVLLHDEESFVRMSVEDILGEQTGFEKVHSENIDLLRNRLENLQTEPSAKELIGKIVQTIDSFLRKHKDSLYPRPLFRAEEYAQKFPNDDRVDQLLRDYILGLIDWYPRVFNRSLDRPFAKRRASLDTDLIDQNLRMFLRDGLKKVLGNVTREFPNETNLPSRLNAEVQEIIDDFYYPRQENLEPSSAAK
ncbi:MAG: hypothetical protein WCT28_03340 [Patescibacteria group bacterium]|jgi:hypothetical protein